MANMLKLFPVFFVLFAFGGSAAAAERTPRTANARLHSLAESLREQEVERFEVVWIDPDAETRNTVRPEDIDKRFFRKYVIRDVEAHKWEKGLIDAIGKTTLSPFDPEAEGDVRWGITFYRRGSDKPLVAIYLAGDGKTGFIAGHDYSIAGPLFGWLNSQFPGNK